MAVNTDDLEGTATLIPKAVRWATYPGDVRHMVEPERGEQVGPNTMGEYLVAVEATYDEEANKTRVGFAYRT